MSLRPCLGLSRAWPGAAVMAAAGFAALLVPATAGAQARPAVQRFLESQDPRVADHDILEAQRRGFRIFGNGDLAFTGMRGTGSLGTYISNVGPCDDQFSFGQCHTGIGGGGGFRFFEIPLIVGLPPSERAKINAAVPGLTAPTGGGWAVAQNGRLFGQPYQNGPADNSLGKLFSGAVSSEDGACTDHSAGASGFLSGGIQLLAGSTCPPTHPPSGFAGWRNISQESWEKIFTGQSAVSFDSGFFQWNEWQVPDSLKDTKFLGSFSTYGATDDYNSDTRALYGAVTPGGVGDPRINGWPMGIRWEFEAFTSSIPSVASAMFWRARVINRSADVYGVGIDYDSLYLGFMPGTGNGGGGQSHSNYYLPEYSAGLYHPSNNTGVNCTAARSSGTTTGCRSFRGSGLISGADFILVLKSPIGDIRNKLFTRTPGGQPCVVGQDPFCDPSHPLRGDTITFNHGHMCGFGGCWANTHSVSDKRAFGLLSGQEDITIDGQTLAVGSSFTFRTFRNIDYPGILGVFNRFVPGVNPWPEKGQVVADPASIWDWNDDGIPDTLKFDSCARNGCVGTSMDTLPGGHVNAYGNVGGILAAGPVRLAAGDTTEFFAVFINDADSVRAWSQMLGATDFYMNFYLGPEAPPPTRIVSTSSRPQVDTLGNTQGTSVQLFLSDDPEEWVDPFLLKLANDMAAAPAGTPLGDLRDLNTGFELRDANGNVVATGLDNALAYRAGDNLDLIEIYKSCDGGNTFTASGDCLADPAQDVDGTSRGFGWRAYSVLRKDNPAFAGNIPNVFTDNGVTGGRNYLYVFVGKSRGANFLINTPTGPDTVEFAPAVRNALSRSTSDVNVTSVYVPISRQAGARTASATFQARPQNSSVPFDVVFTDTATAARYEAIFGNEIQVVETRRGTATGDIIKSDITVRHRATADVGGTATPVVLRSDAFTRMGDEPVALQGSVGVSTVDSIVTRTLSGLGFVLAQGTSVLFGTTTLTGSQATPTRLFAQSVFAGFTIDANNTVSRTFRDEQVRAISASAKQRLGRVGLSDTVQAGVANSQIAHWRQNFSTITSRGGGQYRLTWAAEPFNLPNGIVLNRGDPSATQATFDAALSGRGVGTTGLTDQATATLTGVPLAELVAVKVPFSVVNVTYGNRPVTMAMRQRVSNTYRLGSGNDTLSVTVPADQWVPGDELIFIEDVTRDSTTGVGVVLDGSGQPIRVTSAAVTFSRATVGCNDGNTAPQCNPVRTNTPGAGVYNPGLSQSDLSDFHYYLPFTPSERITFDVASPVRGRSISALTADDLAKIRVVPNPFIVFSTYQRNFPNSTALESPRVAFTGVPPSGTIRVYTVGGQFVQQISWNPSDLAGDGDLYYDLRTREGTDIASGLYIWVLTTGVGGQTNVVKGKFVVIRGTAR